MSENIRKITEYDGRYNKLLGIELPKLEIMQSDGLLTHIQKRHANCAKYIGNVIDIINNPDYVGTNPKEPDSFELVKKYDDNILIGIKLDVKNNYFFVATLHDIKQAKLDRRVNSGRLKKVS